MQHFLTDVPGVRAQLTGPKEGPVLPLTYAARRNKLASHTQMLERLGIKPGQAVAGGPVAGNKAQIVRGGEGSGVFAIIPGVDGLVTDEAGTYLVLTAADCFPVYFADGPGRAVGIAHAGWRGVVDGIVPNTIRKLRELGARPEETRAAIGPGIRACHFEVQDDVLPEFSRWPGHIVERGGRTFVDLPGIIHEQLLESGIRRGNITERTICTYTAPKTTYSARRMRHGNHPEGLDRMLVLIGMPDA